MALVSSSKYPYVFRLIDPSSGYIHDTFLATKKHESIISILDNLSESCFLVTRKVSWMYPDEGSISLNTYGYLDEETRALKSPCQRIPGGACV